MDELSPFSGIQVVVLMFSSQSVKTEILLNFTGYIIKEDPGPTLVIQENVKPMAEGFSKDRLDPMLRDTPALHGCISPKKSRDSENTIQHKKFPGGTLNIIGSNKPGSLASRPIRYLLADEIDRYKASAGKEGSPLKLAFKRTAAFWNKKILLASSPTLEDVGIDAEYKKSDQRKYEVPCPFCDCDQVLEWESLKWPKGEPEKVAYECAHCSELIPASKKLWLIQNGKWRAYSPGKGKAAGFWISQLYSPFVSWHETVEEFLDAKDDPEKLKTFFNTALARVWKERGEAPEWQNVAALRMQYRSGEVPDGVLKITCGVDVHARNLVYVVRGFGAESESWKIEAGEIWGDTNESEVWMILARLMDKRYGDGMMIARMMIDSGYRPDMVYLFCRKFPGRALPTKGHDTQDKPVKTSKLEVDARGRAAKRGIVLWHLDTDYFKGWVHGRINRDSGSPGAWHLCLDATEDYCKQIVSESLLTYPNGKRTWIASGPNHYFDCEVGNAAAAFLLKMDLVQSGRTTEKKESFKGTGNKSRFTGRKKGSWMKGFKK